MIRRFLNAIALVFCLTIFPGVSDVLCAGTETPTPLGNIMPLGDSITRGNDVLGGYRAPLNTLLTEWLNTFTFVGSQTDNTTPTLTAAGQTHHEGHGGYTIAAGGGRSGIDENLVTWIGPSGAAPDKILLMIGTNDINLPYDVANAPARLSVLIDHIYGFRPSVKLYVASIPPIVGRQAEVQAYNATIPGIVASHQALGRNVVYVPMYEAMNIATDLDSFGLHPNAVGYQKIAQVWNEALNTTTTGIVTTTTLNSSVNPSVYHQEVVFTATVQTNGVIATNATGKVVFSVDGVAKAFVDVTSGIATYTDSTLATGIHTIRAVYVGDGTYAASSANSTQTNNPGPASKLAFGVQPSNTAPDSLINPAVTVLVQDADGNTVTGDNITDITVSGTIFSNSTLTVRAVNGVATFSNLKPTTVGSGLTLSASSSLLTGATSSPFDVGVIVISGSFIPPKNTTTTVGKWYSYVIGSNQVFWIGRWNSAGAILNQTGGSITITGQYGNFGIGENPNGWGVYNMSGDAAFSATSLNGASSVYTFSIQGYNGSKMTMTDNAVANIGSLTFGSYGGWGHVELSGNASLTAGKIGYAGNYTFGSGYITFATGSTATLTITGKGAADYQAYVAAGNIRIDGATATFSQFQVSSDGKTLSLAAGGGNSYAGWAGGHAFDSLNSEGVAYGMAWILGSPTHSSPDTLGLLPTSQASGSELVLHFKRVDAMTPAQLHLELSDDLSADSWTTSIPVPATSGLDGGVNFVVTGPDSNGLNDVVAHIPFGGKTKRFARLVATE